MRAFVQSQLASYAHSLLGRAKPAVIAVTGSVGKSSAKEAIAAVLRKKGTVLASPGNYNTEFGVPLAILQLPMPMSKLGWLGTLWAAGARARPTADYPKTLVLEMGADKPGDITELARIAPPDIAVVTTVGESHMQAFGSQEAIKKEKGALVQALSGNGAAVLNRDDANVWGMRELTKGKIVGFGFGEGADVRALEPVSYACSFDGDCGMHFKVQAKGATVPMFLPGVFGRQSIYGALAAVAVGLERGMNLIDIAGGLREFAGLPGRMRYIKGIKKSILIDDTYNAAPKSTLAALHVLREMAAPGSVQRFAVLGDMLELGAVSVAGHEAVGKEAVQCADTLVFVGERMGDASRAALAAGAKPDSVFHFATPEEAGRFVQERLTIDDVVLVKGSRGMQMEKVVKELMADPMAAPSMLVGHHDEWKM